MSHEVADTVDQRVRAVSAFTLVELSIVLVIIGLLVGGVLSGQSLIHASELRTVARQYNGYVTATNAFKDKYFGLPGDITNATTFWGAADGSTGYTAACIGTIGTGTTTCNGNGDNMIGLTESYRFWQQLSNAGLIEGHYTGVGAYTANPMYGTDATNSPAGKVGNGFWYAGLVGFGTVYSTFYDPNTAMITTHNVFEMGGFMLNWNPQTPLFKPEDAWNIDTKMDDGKPATGSVAIMASGGSVAGCTDTSSSTNLTANYLLTNQTAACILLFKGGPFSF